MSVAPPESPTIRNGVSLLTKTGKPKSKYSRKERLGILGATEADLEATIDLLCPGRPYYATTRRDSDDPRGWVTARGRLPEAAVLRHLVGNLTPGINPRWVAPMTWEATKWVGLDVDYRGDVEDFRKRCLRVMKALKRLGIKRESVLVSRTPSGGRHFRFFLTRKLPVSYIESVFELVGIVESPGQIEIFPKMKKGMRLPFGYIPGGKHDPRRWLRFIRAYRRHKVPLVRWLRCVRRAEAYAKRKARGTSRVQKTPPRPKQTHPAEAAAPGRPGMAPRILGIPKRYRVQGSPAEVGDIAQYRSLLGRQRPSGEDIESLIKMGIRCSGTRTQASMRLAWHLVFVRGLRAPNATAWLVKWVYETGSTTSVDVQADLRNGTRKVEQHTAKIVEWMVAKRGEQSNAAVDKSHFAKAEVAEIKRRLGYRARDRVLLSVALNFVRFAKLHGCPTPDGWSAQVAVRGVIQKWPHCQKMRYKPLIEALTACGLITMTLEKRQSTNGTGRPRTYLVSIHPDLREGASMGQDEAIEFALAAGERSEIEEECIHRNVVNRDTYRRIIPPCRGEGTTVKEVEAQQEQNQSEALGATETAEAEMSQAERIARFKKREAEPINALCGQPEVSPSNPPSASKWKCLRVIRPLLGSKDGSIQSRKKCEELLGEKIRNLLRRVQRPDRSPCPRSPFQFPNETDP